MSADTRLKLGVALLIVGLIMPAGTLLVAATDWLLAAKNGREQHSLARFRNHAHPGGRADGQRQL